MSLKLFVTGTDTGIGKTYITVGLLKAFNQLGYSTIGVKPIAAGADKIDDALYNQDGIDLNKASSIKLSYQQTNPIVFEPYISPNIAAAELGQSLCVRDLITKTEPALQHPCDIHLVEGTGGWSLPLNGHETMIDYVKHFKMGVILVVGLRLGCLNHTLLTYHSIKQAGLPVAGWLVNSFEEPSLAAAGIIDTLQQWLDSPYLGLVPFGKNPGDALSIQQLLHPTTTPCETQPITTECRLG
jgi:dethiobiotin synthetase